jgi:hypothetical protein
MARIEENVQGSWGVARRWVIRVLVAGLASWFASLVVFQSGDRYAYSPDASVWSGFEYPTSSVILTVIMIAVEAFLVERLLHHRATKHLWRRALLGGVAMAPLSVIALNTLMDMPPYHAIHLLWIAVMNSVLVGIAIISGVAHFARGLALARR